MVSPFVYLSLFSSSLLFFYSWSTQPETSVSFLAMKIEHALSNFDGTKLELEPWLNKFETVYRITDTPVAGETPEQQDLRKGLYLRLFLQDQAFRVVDALPPSQSSSFVAIVAALRRRFKIDQLEAFRLFKVRTLKENEDVYQYLSDLKVLSKHAFPDVSSELTFLVKAQFLDGLPAGVIKTHCIATSKITTDLDQLATLASNLQHGEETNAVVETTIGGFCGKKSAGKGKGKGKGPITKASSSNVPVRPERPKPATTIFPGNCNYCKEKGHKRADCPKLQGFRAGGSL